MRRAKGLFDKIGTRDNLRAAFFRACKGKRAAREPRQFAAALEENLARMGVEIRSGTIQLGRYRQFVIHDPKERVITAPCFKERVLHHAIMNVCEPVFERRLISDTFACRRGKGRIAALDRARCFARRHPYFVKMDIRKYFDSILHQRLLLQLQGVFKDEGLLRLFAAIIDGFRGEVGQGLPIGSLTSQHFANFYLGAQDRFVKEALHARGYVRYMDDMTLWSDSAGELRAWLDRCHEFVGEKLGLALKADPRVERTRHGMDFLGCRVFGRYMTLNRRSRRRFLGKLTQIEIGMQAGAVSALEAQRQATALVAFTRTPGVRSWRWRARAVAQALARGQ